MTRPSASSAPHAASPLGSMPSAQVASQRQAALGMVSRGEYGRAEPLLKQLIKALPKDGLVRHALGVAQSRLGQQGLALRTLGIAKRLAPEMPEPHLEEAFIHRTSRRFKEAMRAVERALRLAPGNPTCVATKAELLRMTGDVEGAWRVMEELAEGGGLGGNAVIVFADVAKAKGRAGEAIGPLRELLATPGLGAYSRRQALLRLASVLDATGEHLEAFDAAAEAQGLVDARHDVEAFSRAADELIGVWTREGFEGLPLGKDESDLPVLVVGMPRSGTSVVEQIIASHPRAAGASELANITNFVRALEGDRSPLALLTDLSAITQGGLDRESREYLGALREVGGRAERVVDKFTLNGLHLGVACRLLPGARVIYCRRDALDTCVSCFFQNFAGEMPFVHDLRALGAFHRDFDRVMAHWESILDRPVLEVRYEELVVKQERVSREIIEFLGLEWDEACLRFHESGRITSTASNEQVRRPMYASSVGRWKRYEPRLGPLREALGG